MRRLVTTILLAAVACFMVAGSVSAGIDYMSAPWTTVPMGGSIASTQYTSAAGEMNYHRVLAARASGGVDRIYEDGGAWNSYSVISGGTVYTDLSTNRIDTMSAYGTRQGGGIDRIYAYLEGTWHWTGEAIPGTNAVYSSVASEATSGLHRILGAKTGGGVDWITYDNGAWTVSENVLTGSYLDLFADNVTPYVWYGSRIDGGIDKIYIENGVFKAWDIPGVSAVYSGIATSFNTPDRILGAKASGGVDWIYKDVSAWGVAPNVLSATYADLGMDTGAGMQYYFVTGNSGINPANVPDSNDIVVANSSGEVRIVDKSSLETIVSATGLGSVTAVGIQPSDNIVVANSGGDVYVLKQSDLSQITSRSGLGDITALGVQSDGSIVIGTGSGAVSKLDGTTLATTATATSNYGTITSLAVLTGVSKGVDVTDNVAVGNAAGAIYFLSASELGGYTWGPDWGYVRAIAPTPNGNIAFGTDASSGLMFVRTGSDFDGVASHYARYHTIYDIEVKPNGDVVIASSHFDNIDYNGIVLVRRITGGTLDGVASNSNIGAVADMALQSDEDIVLGRVDGTLIILDGASPSISGKISKPGFGTITAVAVIPTPLPVLPATPEFTPAAGTYATPVAVTISSATEGATIRYTTDGSEPTTSSTLYTEPFWIDRTTTVKAKAWDGSVASHTATAVYTIGVALNNPKTIPYASNIVIDGDLSDWAGSEWVALDKEYYTNSQWEFCDMSNARFAMKWGANGTKVYVAIEVTDTDFVFTPAYVNSDSSDRVEMQIHTSAASSEDYITPGNVIAQQYTIGFDGMGGLWTGVAGSQTVPESAGFQYAGSIDAENHKLTYEAAMTPFEYFGGLIGETNTPDTLVAGEIIGADASVCSRTTAYGDYFQLSENLMRHKYLQTAAIGRHLLVKGSSIDTVKKSADGAGVSLTGIVSAIFTDFFYVESPNRESGIRVDMPNHGRQVNQQVTVSGILWTKPSHERYIIGKSVAFDGTMGNVTPLGMTNKSLGGGSLGILPDGQAGVTDGAGLNSIGLLIKTTGLVGAKGTGWFMIDDGSGVSVKVFGTAPAGTPYVCVTGISSCEKDGTGAILRVILATDIQTTVP